MTGKLRYSFMVLISLATVFAASTSVKAGCKEGLVVAYSNWPPYHYPDVSGAPAGLDIEILGNVLSSIKCPFTLRQVPWKRALKEIEHGTVDVGIAASRNADRIQYAWFSTPYRHEAMVMFVRKDEVLKYSPRSLSDLAETDYTVGLVLGIWYGEDLEALFQRKPSFRARVLQQLENKSLLNGLVRGRVDIVVSDLFNGVFAAREDGILDQVKVRPETINDNDVHFMFSKKTLSKEEMQRINMMIKRFIQTSAYKELVHKYVPPEFLSALKP